MGQIIQGILAITIIMFVGWLARRTGAIRTESSAVLTDVVYWIATPALLFHTIISSNVRAVIGKPLLVAAGCGVVAALFFVLVSLVFIRPTGSDLAVGAMCGSLNNAAHVGIPIAVYVLGSAIHGVPVMVFQLGLFTPMFFVLVDFVSSDRKPTICSVAKTVLTNPMVIAAVVGFACAWWSIRVPTLLKESSEMLGHAAPALVLIAFGASMVGKRLRVRSEQGHLIALAVVSKLVVQPLAAFGLGYALDLRSTSLMAVTIMGALPAAQNCFIAAVRARAGVKLAQGAVLITTIGSLFVCLAIAYAFHLAGVV
ncbi:AEC family transporter [Gleimia hominis]|uniref:AEC family transporter n=1 Tax=Gleimia hominis TaxID=595468 RepID=UPI000C803ED7|nr:AEC family transporter [Gleimia hominis]WIK64882.1 AEC family transporter [Gleimia hominis]